MTDHLTATDPLLDEPLPDLAQGLTQENPDLDTYLSRLEARFQEREPQVQAFLPEEGRFERLRRQAHDLRARHPDPAARPDLFGVPLGVKDIFHVDGFPTHAGSRLPPEVLAGPEAESVTQLKAAGVLIAGKTVTTEFAYFAPGPTRNPYNLAHTPGGSSSGSAAAVAAGLCPLALGTQTIGSIIRPAAFCGVVGFKPSYDRISREGVIPLSPSVDHIGFFTRDAEGALLVASLLCRDWQEPQVSGRPVLGIPEGPYLDHAEPEGLDHFRATCRRLQEAGFEVRAVPAMTDFEDVRARHEAIVAAEAARVHARWFEEFGDRYHPKTVDLIRRGQDVSDEDLAAALQGRQQLRDELTALMDQHGLDLWVAPPAPGPAPPGLDSTGNPIMNLPWTHAGLPAVNLPAGRNAQGLPMGLQVVGRWYGDEALLAWAIDLEAALQAAGGRAA